MSSSGYAHSVAGVKIQDYLEVTEKKETRESFSPDWGNKVGEFETIQYTYVLFGKEMPIVHKEYPDGGAYSAPNKRYGWNMRKNFWHWMSENGFNEDEDNTVWCDHDYAESQPVCHPVGILGAALKTYSSSDTYKGVMSIFEELKQQKLDKLVEKAAKRLQKLGCTDQPALYLYAKCG